MTSPLVSILIPCYNAQEYVGAAVASALNQTYRNVEVVVVDDGSKDASVEVLKGLEGRIVFEAGPNRGGCAARNRALELSHGRFIQFLDADDTLDPRKIERQIHWLLEDKADMVLCKIGLDWPPPRPRAEEAYLHPVPQGDPFLYFLRYPIQTAGPLHRREHLERVGGFRLGLRSAQEFDLHLRLALRRPRLAMVDDILVWVRMHEGDRVSKQRDFSHIAGVLTDVGRELLESGQADEERRRVYAQKLFVTAIRAARNGLDEHAQRALTLARELDPRASAPGSPLTRLSRRVLGPLRVERCMRRLRTLRDAWFPVPGRSTT